MLELNNIYNMDCIEGLRKIDDNSIDLIVTSPPYNLGVNYDTYSDDLPWDEYMMWCKEWLNESFRVLKDDGRICINNCIACSPRVGGNNSTKFPLFDYMNIMKDIGYGIHNIAIWDDLTITKQSAWGSWLSASSPYLSAPYEGILIGYKKQWKKINKGESTISKTEFMELCSGVWHIGTTAGYTKACFPEKLPQLCINGFSYKGDVVLDPFSGSGTTCYVAKSLDRKYIGFEISPTYHMESLSRLLGSPYKVEEIDNPYGNSSKNNKKELW